MNRSVFIRCIIFITSAVLISACATTPEKSKIIQHVEVKPDNLIKIKPSADSLNHAQQVQDNQEWQSAFTAWKNIITESKPEQQAGYANKAALMLLKLDNKELIPNFYSELNADFSSPNDRSNRDVLLASSFYQQGKTYQSLSTLPDIESINNQTFLAIALNVRAQAILNIGKPLDSAKIRLKLAPILATPEEKETNFLALWDSIQRISDNSIIKTLKKPQDTELRGWLELSLIARRSNMLPIKLEPWLKQWHSVYPSHSGSQFATNLLLQSKNIYLNPTKIALMLPLEGKLSKVSNAILDGFLYAHYQAIAAKTDTGNQHKTLEIEVIPVDTTLPFKAQYNTAILNGADFIVGPLNKNSVAELASQTTADVPTLALNYSQQENNAHNLFQFGLKPEDEAEQVADYALLDSHYTAATLMPDTAWGQRLNKAFKLHYERLGGSIYSEAKYPSKSNDYGLAIKNLLNLSQSKSRHSFIQTVIGEKTEFHPRRRQDIDMIFIGANARQARIIKPQLKFHYAQDIQVYGTSHIANSNSKKSADNDRDLNGVYYVDMPWTLKSKQFNETKDIAKYWPTLNKSHGKLFALGIDAYRLIPQLKRLKLNPNETYKGLTGNLSIDQQGLIHRELLLATYKKGKQVEITPEISQ